MSTSPEPATGDNGDGTAHSTSEDTAKGKAKDTGDLKFMVTAVYPLLGGATLWILGLFVLMSGEENYTLLFVGAAIALIGGVHRWLRWVLEGRDEPRPWQFPTVLSTAMTASVCVAALPLLLNIDPTLPLLLLAPIFALLGTAVFSLVKRPQRFTAALAAIIALALVLVGISWLKAAQERWAEREEHVQSISEFPHPIGVLDLPDWEPTSIWVGSHPPAVFVTYEPADPSPETEGDRLMLRTRDVEAFEETGWPPLRELCATEGGNSECEEHGDVVVADLPGALEARTEFTTGVTGNLVVSTRAEDEGGSGSELSEIGSDELAEMAGQIRAAEPGEAEEIASDTAD